MIRSSLIVTILALFGSVVSFLGQIVVAHFFGAGAELDAYLVGISLPLTAAGLGAGILGYQVVPALRPGENTAGNSAASLLGLVLGLGGCATLLALAGILSSPWLVPLLTGTLPAASQPVVLQISRVAWLWLPLAVVGAVLTGGLHVRQKFALATLLQPLPALGALIGCLLGHINHGVSALAWGQLAGYLVMVMILCALSGPAPRRPDWQPTRRILREAPLALTALLVFVFYPLPDAIWGARAGIAGVSLLGYAQRLIVGFAGLAVVGAATVLFPRLARQAAAGAHTALKDDLSRSLRTLLACMAPAAAVLGVLALPIVRFIFVRGAFGEPEAVALAHLLPWMFGGMVAMSGMTLAFKALFAQGRVRQAAAFSATGAMLYSASAGLLVGTFGLPGIGAAYALAWWVVFGLAVRALQASTPADGAYLVRLIAVTVLCGGTAWLGRIVFLPRAAPDQWHALLALAGIAIGAGAVFCAASLVWPGLDEIRLLARHLRGGRDV